MLEATEPFFGEGGVRVQEGNLRLQKVDSTGEYLPAGCAVCFNLSAKHRNLTASESCNATYGVTFFAKTFRREKLFRVLARYRRHREESLHSACIQICELLAVLSFGVNCFKDNRKSRRLSIFEQITPSPLLSSTTHDKTKT